MDGAGGGRRGAGGLQPHQQQRNATAATDAAAPGAGAGSMWLTPLGAAAASAAGSDAWTAAATPAAIAAFRADGFVTLRSLLPAPFTQALLLRHQALLLRGGGGGGGDDGSPPRMNHDAPQLRDTLWNEELSLYVGLHLLPAVEALAGQRLSSTYTFSIAYRQGGVLHPHVDRAQNAISLSLTLGREPAHLPPWPLYVAPRGKGEADGIPVLMASGDALLYRGEHHVHYRRPLDLGTSLHVVFGFRDVHADHCNSN